jgi:hypothetical protein
MHGQPVPRRVPCRPRLEEALPEHARVMTMDQEFPEGQARTTAIFAIPKFCNFWLTWIKVRKLAE